MADDLAGLLCPEEQARAERLLSERDRRLWTRSRGLLRALLSRYLHEEPSALRFATGAHGKPELSDEADGPSSASQHDPSRQRKLSFNLSHSGQLALYAFTEAGPVGVDVEVARRSIDEIALAARVFGPAEARRLEELEPAIREGEFLRVWTRHEAQLKCHGTGIGAGTANASELWIAELDIGAGAAATVALERPPREMRCWDWPG